MLLDICLSHVCHFWCFDVYLNQWSSYWWFKLFLINFRQNRLNIVPHREESRCRCFGRSWVERFLLFKLVTVVFFDLHCLDWGDRDSSLKGVRFYYWYFFLLLDCFYCLYDFTKALWSILALGLYILHYRRLLVFNFTHLVIEYLKVLLLIKLSSFGMSIFLVSTGLRSWGSLSLAVFFGCQLNRLLFGTILLGRILLIIELWFCFGEGVALDLVFFIEVRH